MNAEGRAKIRQALALCYQLLGEPEPDDDEYGQPMAKIAAAFADRLGQLPTRSDLAAVSAEFEAAKAELATSIGTLHRQFEARAHRKDI